MTAKKLRIQSVTIHVALILDDGDQIEPGPALNPVTLSLSQARVMLATLPEEVKTLEAQLTKVEEAQ